VSNDGSPQRETQKPSAFLSDAERASNSVRFYDFDGYRIDTKRHLLMRDGEPIAIKPKALDMLLLLVRHPGRLLGKEELMNRLWPDTVVEEANLTQNVFVVRKALGEAPGEQRFIATVARQGYRFVGNVREVTEDEQSSRDDALPGVWKEPARRYQTMLDVRNELQELTEASRSSSALARRRRRPRSVIAAAAIALIVLVVASMSWWRNRGANPAPRVVALTTLEGWERTSTFSPDGEQVAFDYETSQRLRDTDIYVTLAGGDVVRRLTSDPAVEANAAWSPDGRHIAFGRRRQPDDMSGHVRLISPLGGPDRKLSDLPVMVGFGGQISWSADSRFIAAGRWRPGMSRGESTAIHLIPTRVGEARRLTNATMPAIDREPAFAPDGRRLAYVACNSVHPLRWHCDVMVVDLDAELTVRGAPRRLTSIASHIMGVAWARDGKSLIFGTQALAGVFYLWRVDSGGRRAAERLELPGLGAAMPATVPSRDRLAFARHGDNMDVYRVEAGGRSAPLVTSTFGDFQAVFSPDGRRVAFCSSRTGESVEIWVAAADGSGAQQLTHGMGRFQAAPRWSPDGRTIAFSSQTTSGQWHVWTIDVDGGTPRQITRGAGAHEWPSWSGDGQRIYFARDAGRGPNVWSIDLDSGREAQITQQGGTKGVESADGKRLVYLPSLEPSRPLLTMPLGGGAPQQLLPCTRRWFFVSPRGIYYVPCGADAMKTGTPTTGILMELSLRLIDRAGEDRPIATLIDPVLGDPGGLAISPDGTGIVYTRQIVKGSDLMLIENFR
jgi:Tol biopolymer transport system component/DNA-binding winged helix-turn-helix (wHTH) protein